MKENARLRAELNELRNSPELLLRKLPQELWLNILGYLKPGELCQVLTTRPAPCPCPCPCSRPPPQAGLACRGLLQLSRDPSLWPSLTLLGDALADTQTVLVLVARYSLLQTGRLQVPPAGAPTWPGCPSQQGTTLHRSSPPWRSTAPSSPPSLSSLC